MPMTILSSEGSESNAVARRLLAAGACALALTAVGCGKKQAKAPAAPAGASSASAASGDTYVEADTVIYGSGASGGGSGGAGGGGGGPGPSTRSGPGQYVLTVTWIVPGREPSTTESVFGSDRACRAAARDLLAEAKRKRQETARAAQAGGEQAVTPEMAASCQRR